MNFNSNIIYKEINGNGIMYRPAEKTDILDYTKSIYYDYCIIETGEVKTNCYKLGFDTATDLKSWEELTELNLGVIMFCCYNK